MYLVKVTHTDAPKQPVVVRHPRLSGFIGLLSGLPRIHCPLCVGIRRRIWRDENVGPQLMLLSRMSAAGIFRNVGLALTAVAAKLDIIDRSITQFPFHAHVRRTTELIVFMFSHRSV